MLLFTLGRLQVHLPAKLDCGQWYAGTLEHSLTYNYLCFLVIRFFCWSTFFRNGVGKIMRLLLKEYWVSKPKITNMVKVAMHKPHGIFSQLSFQ